MDAARESIAVNMRYLDPAVFAMRPVRSHHYDFGTDGRHLLYSSEFVIREALKGQGRITEVTRDMMHVLLHCLMRHWHVSKTIDRTAWDLACDIAVESMIEGFNMKCFESGRSREIEPVLRDLKYKVSLSSAEKIYRYIRSSGMSRAEQADLRKLFAADDHSMWSDAAMAARRNDGGGSGLEHDRIYRSGEIDEFGAPDDMHESDWMQSASLEDVLSDILEDELADEDALDWDKIGRYILSDLESDDRNRGYAAGSMRRALAAEHRRKEDFGSFLRKFAVFGENLRVDPASFDYIYYTYGLKLYGNVPLIEPLEYGDDHRIRDFVIVLDTSGSTSGRLIEGFLRKTFDVMKSTETFFDKINLHVIQADARVQEDVILHDSRDIDDYLKNMTVRGMGGTDFRPAFMYVDQLIRKGAFEHLKGLLYFTDGYGIFPKRKPEYDAAFVFLGDNYDDRNVPAWAMKLVLEDEDI